MSRALVINNWNEEKEEILNLFWSIVPTTMIKLERKEREEILDTFVLYDVSTMIIRIMDIVYRING